MKRTIHTREKQVDGPCIIVAGSLYNGLTFIGPFRTVAEAKAYDDEHRGDDTPPSPVHPLFRPNLGISIDDAWHGWHGRA